MKKIEDLLVGVPYFGDMLHTDWDSHIVAAHSSEGSAWGSGLAVGEPVASSLKLEFERFGVANWEKVVRVLDSDPGMESRFDCLVADSGVV